MAVSAGIPARRAGSPAQRRLSLAGHAASAVLLLCCLAAPAARAGGSDAAPAAPALPAFDGGFTDTIVVTASRPVTASLPVAPAVTTVLPLEEETGGADLAELLARAAGLQVRRYGGLGAPAVPSIRGSTGAQVAILVDGVPLADAQDGAVDLTGLPLERFARAEIHRGLVPAASGGVGGVGAVNLITRPATAAGLAARTFAGSFGDVGGRLTHGAVLAGGRLRHQLSVHGRRSDQRFSFLDHNQTFHNAADDRVRERRNAQFAEFGGLLVEDWRAGPLELRAKLGYFRRDAGRPGPLGYESPHAALRLQRGDGHLSLRAADGFLRLDLTGRRRLELLHDDLREVGSDPAGTVRSLADELYGRAILAPRWRLGAGAASPRLNLRAGADGRREWYRERLGDDAEPLRRRTTTTVFAEADLELPDARLALMPGWRWTRAEDDFPPYVPPWMPWLAEEPLAAPHVVHAVTPSAGLVWDLAPGRLQAVAHAARAVRLPTWVELFGHRGGIDGNRELKPERSRSCDIGLHWRDARGDRQLRLIHFWTWTEDAILFVQNSQRTSKALNFGGTRARGVELEVAGSLAGRLRAALNLTWQRARDDGADPAYHGKELPFLAPLELRLDLDGSWGAWRPGLSLVHEARNYRDRYNVPLEMAPARTLLDLRLARSWDGASSGRLLTVTAELINATDDDVYDVEGYPLPGRSARLSLHLR